MQNIRTLFFLHKFVFPWSILFSLTVTERIGRSQPVCKQQRENHDPLHRVPQTRPRDHFLAAKRSVLSHRCESVSGNTCVALLFRLGRLEKSTDRKPIGHGPRKFYTWKTKNKNIVNNHEQRDNTSCPVKTVLQAATLLNFPLNTFRCRPNRTTQQYADRLVD